MSSAFETSADVQLRMPAESLKTSFHPQSFFKINPAMDVPEAKDTRSVPAPNGGNCTGCN